MKREVKEKKSILLMLLFLEWEFSKQVAAYKMRKHKFEIYQAVATIGIYDLTFQLHQSERWKFQNLT